MTHLLVYYIYIYIYIFIYVYIYIYIYMYILEDSVFRARMGLLLGLAPGVSWGPAGSLGPSGAVPWALVGRHGGPGP